MRELLGEDGRLRGLSEGEGDARRVKVANMKIATKFDVDDRLAHTGCCTLGRLYGARFVFWCLPWMQATSTTLFVLLGDVVFLVALLGN